MITCRQTRSPLAAIFHTFDIQDFHIHDSNPRHRALACHHASALVCRALSRLAAPLREHCGFDLSVASVTQNPKILIFPKTEHAGVFLVNIQAIYRLSHVLRIQRAPRELLRYTINYLHCNHTTTWPAEPLPLFPAVFGVTFPGVQYSVSRSLAPSRPAVLLQNCYDSTGRSPRGISCCYLVLLTWLARLFHFRAGIILLFSYDISKRSYCTICPASLSVVKRTTMIRANLAFSSPESAYHSVTRGDIFRHAVLCRHMLLNCRYDVMPKLGVGVYREENNRPVRLSPTTRCSVALSIISCLQPTVHDISTPGQ
ncbi:hypothetical protein F4782DRAFT_180512 [Xylaria castorea]|nr:hypothetical protein F4782DRAFT_180512 [Xylaria castorea]